MYHAGEVRYISVNNILQGKLLSRHWNQKKQMFIPSAPFSEENNDALVRFKKQYDDALADWEGSLFSFALTARKVGVEKIQKEGDTLAWVLDWCIENAKKSVHSDGTLCGTFETYEKVKRRVEEYCQEKHLPYAKLKMADVDTVLVNDMLEWQIEKKGGKGQYFSTMFRAALNKAVDNGWLDKSVVENSRWVKRIRNNERKYETLSDEQCRRFIEMPIDELPKALKKALFRDFCVFTLYTCQSPCDAITLRYSDIKVIDGVEHFVFKRRKIEKKQMVECTVPINKKMREIMQRWKKQAEDGYIFPIRSKKKLKEMRTNNMDIKKFVQKCNVWLKKVGDMLGCKFPLRNYTFRHTAITHYMSKGIPTIYVANLAGTSVENCEKIYYNNRGDVASRDKVLNAVSF